MALVGAVGLAACGDNSSDSDVSARTAVAPSGIVGSDVHLENQAADIAARASVTNGSDVHLQNQAAENAEREAHLAANATTAARTAQDDTSNDDFVPGTRRMPVR